MSGITTPPELFAYVVKSRANLLSTHLLSRIVRVNSSSTVLPVVNESSEVATIFNYRRV